MSRLIKFCFSLMFCCCVPNVQSQQGQPWIVESNSFAMLGFSVDPKSVQAFLPEGFTPHLNDKKQTSLIVEIYSAERIAGIPAYKTIFIVAEVAGYPSKGGTPGHYAIWGRLDSQTNVDFFKSLGFPYQLAQTLDIQPGKIHRTKIADASGELLSIQLESSTDAPFSGQGVVDMLVLKNRQMLKSEVSYLTQANFAKVNEFKVLAKNDSVLNLLKGLAADWSLVSDKQVFSYSHLVSLKKIIPID
jgi:hypothetical protein